MSALHMGQTLRRMVRFSVAGVEVRPFQNNSHTAGAPHSKFGAAETSRFAGRETTHRNPQPPEHEFL
jgi:hypothetical protein